MEIISYVLEGHLEHQDTMGNRSTIGPGETQVISGGTGFAHSEDNPSETEPAGAKNRVVVYSERP